MSSHVSFETSLEKIARILGRSYGVEVIFEGNQAKTDGKKIILPSCSGKLTDNLRKDLNGYLDHEVGHIKFTDFIEMKKVKNRFQMELWNAAEDQRIEDAMIEEFPGTALNLEPLREKVIDRNQKRFEEYSWPVKIITATQALLAGKTTEVSDDIKDYIPLIEEYVPLFSEAESTKEIVDLSKRMMTVIVEKFEEEEKPKSKGGKGKSGLGEEEFESAMKMLKEEVGEKDSEFDKEDTSVSGMVNKELGEETKNAPATSKNDKDMHRSHDYTMGTDYSIPVTTRFDKVTDHSSTGNAVNYNKLRHEVMPMVQSIKIQFERILKVKENAHWKTERERGAINPRTLAKLATDQTYRTPFKEFRKTDTKNVAVQILVDMSGSMGGTKIKTAKMATIAMGEALKALDINFEITGFTSVGDSRVSAYAAELGIDRYGSRGKTRFNRMSERLDLYVFKSFDCPHMNGIEKMESMSNNPDGECVKWAAKRLETRKEKRKILFVLSDGMPAADGDGTILNYDLKMKVQQIIKSGIECVGFGICTDAVKMFYPDYVVVNDLKSLPGEAMSKLCKLIVK